MWYTHTMDYYSAIKKNEIVPLQQQRKDLEMVIVSEARERQIPYAATYMWNLKSDTNELICETETGL